MSMRNFRKPSQQSLSTLENRRFEREAKRPTLSGSETEILFSDDSISSLPNDVADALNSITLGLQGIVLHPCDIFTHDLLFRVDIMSELYVSFRCAYTNRNFKELLNFSKTIRESQPVLNIFTPTGYKQGEKRIDIVIKRWDVV